MLSPCVLSASGLAGSVQRVAVFLALSQGFLGPQPSTVSWMVRSTTALDIFELSVAEVCRTQHLGHLIEVVPRSASGIDW